MIKIIISKENRKQRHDTRIKMKEDIQKHIHTQCVHICNTLYAKPALHVLTERNILMFPVTFYRG